MARKASCVTYVTEDVSLPPILLMHSQDDPVVSVDNTRTLYERLIQTQHPVTYYELKGCTLWLYILVDTSVKQNSGIY